MAIEVSSDGSITITGDDIKLYQLLTLKSALSLQVLGIKAMRNTSATAVGRKLGFPAKTAREMLPQVVQAIESYVEQHKENNDGE